MLKSRSNYIVLLIVLNFQSGEWNEGATVCCRGLHHSSAAENCQTII